MSENWISVIPTEPTFIPDESKAQLALTYLEELMPKADILRMVSPGNIFFVDAGANFESVHCPLCRSALDTAWWDHEMEAAANTEFTQLAAHMPCCGASSNLNDLGYVWPHGFAMWAIEALNADIGELSQSAVNRLQTMLGHSIRVIYTHV